MGIASIADYPLPTRDELPPARVAWTLEPGRAALLVHDMQRYFVAPFRAGGSPIAPVTANIARLIAACRAAGVPVFYTAQDGDQPLRDRGLQADFWGPGMTAAAEHRDIIPALAPAAEDIRLVKHRYSAFQRSDLEALMRTRGRDQLVVAGIYAHIGCMATVAEAFQRDIQPFLVADAVAAFSRDTHDLAVRAVASCCGIVATTDDILAALPAGRPGREPLTLDRMRADIAAALREAPEAIGLDDNLMDLGLDSMRAMALLLDWSSKTGVTLEFAEIAERMTLAGWWSVVEARQTRHAPAGGSS